jgi:hypothetical protein
MPCCCVRTSHNNSTPCMGCTNRTHSLTAEKLFHIACLAAVMYAGLRAATGAGLAAAVAAGSVRDSALCCGLLLHAHQLYACAHPWVVHTLHSQLLHSLLAQLLQ